MLHMLCFKPYIKRRNICFKSYISIRKHLHIFYLGLASSYPYSNYAVLLLLQDEPVSWIKEFKMPGNVRHSTATPLPSSKTYAF